MWRVDATNNHRNNALCGAELVTQVWWHSTKKHTALVGALVTAHRFIVCCVASILVAIERSESGTSNDKSNIIMRKVILFGIVNLVIIEMIRCEIRRDEKVYAAKSIQKNVTSSHSNSSATCSSGIHITSIER